MPYTEQLWKRYQLETLMDIATTLADYTQTIEDSVKVPAYLSRVLGVEPITLAVIRQEGDAEPRVLLAGSSGQVATGEAAANFHHNLLEIHRQTRPLSAGDAPMLRPAIALGNADTGFSQLAVQDLAAFPLAKVFARTIDDSHRMFLIVHKRADELPLSKEIVDMLLLVAGQLAKLLKCAVVACNSPEALGGPFDRLTDREWVVLRGLNSDDGEKQLADRLNLSPHTLHSHIKSIYRKVGVQGRLPLLLRLNEAIRDLRKTTINTRPAPLPAAAPNASPERTVAVG